MDTTGKIVLGVVTVVAVVCSTVLMVCGKGDALTVGVVSTLVLQVATYLTTSGINTKVNGHMSTLIDRATTHEARSATAPAPSRTNGV